MFLFLVFIHTMLFNWSLSTQTNCSLNWFWRRMPITIQPALVWTNGKTLSTVACFYIPQNKAHGRAKSRRIMSTQANKENWSPTMVSVRHTWLPVYHCLWYDILTILFSLTVSVSWEHGMPCDVWISFGYFYVCWSLTR